MASAIRTSSTLGRCSSLARHADILLDTSRRIAEKNLGGAVKLMEYSRVGGSCRSVYALDSDDSECDYESIVYDERFDTWYATRYFSGKTVGIYGCHTEVRP